ncbi:hypothetical protein MMC08_008885 [Hypocenomyce scalaris]|nr:hypothetical protein [Hypocenomyce scalaris]
MPAVRQSSTKSEFYRAVGLNEQVAEDNNKFEAMWKEAKAGWYTYLQNGDRNVLKLEYRDDASVQQPWKWEQLDPTAINNAITAIWGEGEPWPRYYYNLGHVEDGRVYNWVLRWLLWHICRHRDWRNRRQPGAQASPSNDDAGAMPTNDYWATVMNR